MNGTSCRLVTPSPPYGLTMHHICSNARAAPGQPAQWHKCCSFHITTGDTGLRSRYSLARANLVNRGVGL